ncbi:bifunctional adenosylcobinamide kinase/adenosylcobinamide-phosphate guanylyltransferase [Salibacterium salarium]|uniref:bifunctional adenosylcobinamide kinase/adenosylcobinamide-phosphate guanylyltransferase n=1 Tax=Salibacterium salarium TaxID=284579 RepID=UPI0016398E30|nr:bifunctional adenosylcobinamide kinase/adenosylcobinamide-phosphate guanylyltransferase [Salibacterium salarium]
MQVVTGGAFNGKKEWVLKQIVTEYHLGHTWFNLYKNMEYGWLPVSDLGDKMVVIEGIEAGLKQAMDQKNQAAPLFFQEYLLPLLSWEKKYAEREVIIIGTDISKGIVPLEKQTRDWRDETGRLYQNLFQNADHVYRIWFGIAQQLK